MLCAAPPGASEGTPARTLTVEIDADPILDATGAVEWASQLMGIPTADREGLLKQSRELAVAGEDFREAWVSLESQESGQLTLFWRRVRLPTGAMPVMLALMAKLNVLNKTLPTRTGVFYGLCVQKVAPREEEDGPLAAVDAARRALDGCSRSTEWFAPLVALVHEHHLNRMLPLETGLRSRVRI